MSEKTTNSIPDSWTIPLVAGKFALDAAMLASLSLARFAQIGARSADAAIGKYIELTEQELKRGPKREAVKVD